LPQDPFYDCIHRALGGRLDPDAFEHCAVDLLRPHWPGIASVPGGSDGGLDGAVGQALDPPFPLVSSTARPRERRRNLRRNLQTYLSRGGPRRHAIFATSQVTGATKRTQLEQEAAALGFTLLQVYGRDDFADLLYRSPRWTKELLGLSGRSSALSTIPLTSRPVFGDKAIGRAEELRWLSRSPTSDKVLLGQPGSGKTFLLRLLARGSCISTHQVHSETSIIPCSPFWNLGAFACSIFAL
jgi:hypothetical protein